MEPEELESKLVDLMELASRVGTNRAERAVDEARRQSRYLPTIAEVEDAVPPPSENRALLYDPDCTWCVEGWGEYSFSDGLRVGRCGKCWKGIGIPMNVLQVLKR